MTWVGRPFATVHFSVVGGVLVRVPCGFVGSGPLAPAVELRGDWARRKTIRKAATTATTGPTVKMVE
jgi:hypothetical protein